jgi:hypothetical protein
MVTQRTGKIVFIVIGCMLALLMAVLPAMAMIPTDSDMQAPSAKSSRNRSVPAAPAAANSQEAAAAAPQAKAVAVAVPDEAAAVAVPATATTAPIMTVDAGPIARPVAPVTVAPAAEVAAAPAEAVAPAATVEEAVVVIAPVVLPASGGETEFTGTVSSLTGVLPNLTLIVGGHTVKTDTQTDISGTLSVGVLVEVKGTAQPDSSILASRIRVQDAGGGGGTEVEFRGPIVALPTDLDLNGNWIVGNVTVTVTLATTVLPTRTAAALGAIAEVHALRQPDGSLLAIKIQIEHAGAGEGEVEFRGPIVALPGTPDLNGPWVVGNLTVTVNLTTTVLPTRTAAVLGAIAEVKAQRQPDGSLLAIKIKLEDEHEFENEVEFKGLISDLTGTGPYTMTIVNHTVKTNAQTQINITLTNGMLVEVNGQLQPDGSVLASRITAEDQGAPVEVEFTARITGTLPAGFIGTWTFDNGKTVTVTTSTLIDQSRGAAEMGARVEVKALKQPDNSLLAIRIKVED